MSRLIGLTTVLLLGYLSIAPAWLFLSPPESELATHSAPRAVVDTPESCHYCPPAPNAIVFTGDVMLARHVERLADQYGDHYSFTGLSKMLTRSDVVVTNFEASIPAKHVTTPDFAMRFSVPYRLAALLPAYSMRYVSLANNHADDFGESGYTHTKQLLTQAGVTAFGHPAIVQTTSITYIELTEVRVAVLGINATYQAPDAAELTKIVTEASDASDWQVAYVHWGDEYQLHHNLAQRSLAAQLVAAGVDVIIGHHPHVVQDVDIIDGVPVFYSLGNFIFDQYFSSAVQEGLLVRLRFSASDINYELLPVTTKYSTAQPQLMTKAETTRFLTELRGRSQLSITDQFSLGLLPDYRLASSTQISIMTE